MSAGADKRPPRVVASIYAMLLFTAIGFVLGLIVAAIRG